MPVIRLLVHDGAKPNVFRPGAALFAQVFVLSQGEGTKRGQIQSRPLPQERLSHVPLPPSRPQGEAKGSSTRAAAFSQMEIQDMSTFYAQPYTLDATGFFFDSLDQYEENVSACRDRFGNPIEEFELQFIDGDAEDAAAFAACRVSQANIQSWFEDVECLPTDEKTALFFLCDVLGSTPEDALRRLDDVCIYRGPLKDAAAEFFDEVHGEQIPARLRHYIDYEAFARDCEVGGDMTEFKFAGETFTCTNASAV